MLRADKIVLHALRKLLRLGQHPRHINAHAQAILPLHTGDLIQDLLQADLEHRQIYFILLENRIQKPFRLLDQCQQHMSRGNLLMIMQRRRLLRRLQCLQCFLCIFFLSHDISLPSCFPHDL